MFGGCLRGVWGVFGGFLVVLKRIGRRPREVFQKSELISPT